MLTHLTCAVLLQVMGYFFLHRDMALTRPTLTTDLITILRVIHRLLDGIFEIAAALRVRLRQSWV